VAAIVLIVLAEQAGLVWALSVIGAVALGLGIWLPFAAGRRAWRALDSSPVTTPAQPAIRPIALGLIRNGDRILVFEGQDEVKGETFYRPLGGGIEFGERAVDALHREFHEELAVELSDVTLLGVLENIFTVYGRAGHEIVYVFEASLADTSWYERDDLGAILDEGSPVSWQPVNEFISGRSILYPHGLDDRLADQALWSAS
jgi:8-oxo-dGTP pyrophosphatase MutT (NUDIX family)